MKFIKSTSWEAIEKTWQKNEEPLQDSRNKTNNNGQSSWKTWRQPYINAVGASELIWHQYRTTPNEAINWSCGAFQIWIKRAMDIRSRVFKELATHKCFEDHEKINPLMNSFPQTIELIALKKNDSIYVFEGHHRLISLALLIEQNPKFSCNIIVNLAKIPNHNPFPLIDYTPPELGK
ncbi:MAG: hypothetical protein P1V18_05275 [Candidatus Gracilibacteria bacterium]|nr:hypothetical protein [Candidatus Gracilibacteria bacterium]